MASNIPDDGSRCPICFEIYREPKALVCLHTFCEKCIHEYILQSKEKGLLCEGIECPLCRFVTPFETDQPPESWAKSLRPNFALASLLESTSYCHKPSLKDEMCQPCLKQNSTKPAIVFCTVCNERLCNECKRVHDSLEFTKNHKSVSTERKENVEFLEELKSYQKCESHGKKIKFYCKSERKLYCSICAITAQSDGKELVDISEMVQDRCSIRQSLLLRKEILELENFAKTASAHFVNESKKLASQITESMSNWKDIREKLSQRLDDLDDIVHNMIKEIQSAKTSGIMNNAVACDEIAYEMRRLLTILDIAKENGTEEQIFVIGRKIINQYEQQKKQADLKFEEAESTNISLNVSQKMEDLLNTSEDIVSLSVKSEAVPSLTAKTLKILAETNIKKTRFRGVGFLNDGRIVACDSNNKKCVLMNERFEELGATSLQASPLDVTVTEKNQVIITTGENKKLLMYLVDENNTFIEKDVIPVTLNCDSASLFDANKGIFCTFGIGKPVHVITFEGDIDKGNSAFEGKQFATNTSYKCCYTEEKKLLLMTNYIANAVHVCDLQNEKMHTVKDDRFVKLRGICHYINDMFFICSSGNDSVIQMSAAGQVVGVTRVDIKRPYSICISSSKDKLLVSNNLSGHRKLLLFEIQ